MRSVISARLYFRNKCARLDVKVLAKKNYEESPLPKVMNESLDDLESASMEVMNVIGVT